MDRCIMTTTTPVINTKPLHSHIQERSSLCRCSSNINSSVLDRLPLHQTRPTRDSRQTDIRMTTSPAGDRLLKATACHPPCNLETNSLSVDPR